MLLLLIIFGEMTQDLSTSDCIYFLSTLLKIFKNRPSVECFEFLNYESLR